MDPGSNEALLQQLLQHVTVLVGQLKSPLPRQETDNPLHTAASLGLPHVTRVIVDLHPEFAIGFNEQGLTPMHVAAANGHFKVVHELLQSKIGSDLCHIKGSKDGLLPIHTAAINGRVSVLMELIHAYPRFLLKEPIPFQGGSILHLAVKSNCFAAVEFLVQELGWNKNLLNSKNEEGNTILHLAAEMKQHQMVKLLVSNPRLDVNVKNGSGFTSFDMLEPWSNELADSILIRIRSAAGKKSSVIAMAAVCLQSIFQVLLFKPLRLFKRVNASIKKRDDKYKDTRNTLMVVNALVATFTFQGALNPPGGFTQMSDENIPYSDLFAGEALLHEHLKMFLWYDMIAFFSSLIVILLMLTLDPRKQFMIWALMLITWIAVMCTGLTFIDAVKLIFADVNYTWFICLIVLWIVITCMFVGVLILRSSSYLLRKYLWFEKKRASLEEAVRDGKIRIKRETFFYRHPRILRVGLFIFWGFVFVGFVIPPVVYFVIMLSGDGDVDLFRSVK